MADYDLELVQNTTYERTFSWKQNGVVQSLVGYAHHSNVRAKEDVTSELLLNLTLYMTRIEGDTKIRLRVPGGVLAGLDPRGFKKAAWDLVLVNTTDPTDRRTLLEGAATLNPATTVVPA